MYGTRYKRYGTGYNGCGTGYRMYGTGYKRYWTRYKMHWTGIERYGIGIKVIEPVENGNIYFNFVVCAFVYAAVADVLLVVAAAFVNVMVSKSDNFDF